jgi:putative RNA 2'-phosphotransferase
MEPRLVRLSKTISHALRHAPWLYELEPDAAGWVPLDDLLAALQARAGTRGASAADVAAIVAQADKRRFELRDGAIRALYGHSLPGKLARTPAAPPDLLYHGTTATALPAIRAEGLRPMGRQYVHLSTDVATARQVAGRKRGAPVILTVWAGEAHRAGVPFYLGNEQVWLADAVPARYLAFPEA